MIIQFLDSLPETFASTRDIHSATGAAMEAALKLMVSRNIRKKSPICSGVLKNDVKPLVFINPYDT